MAAADFAAGSVGGVADNLHELSARAAVASAPVALPPPCSPLTEMIKFVRTILAEIEDTWNGICQAYRP